jgi:serine/threonine protein kinase
MLGVFADNIFPPPLLKDRDENLANNCHVQKVAKNNLTLIAKGSGKEVYSSSSDEEHVFYRPRMFKQRELKSEMKTARDIGNTLKENGVKAESLAIDYEEVEVDDDYAVKTSKMDCSLDRYLATTEVDLGGRLDLGLDLCSGVATLHAANRVHGDLKPDNFLLRVGAKKVDTRMKLSDFGKTKVVQGSDSKISYTGNKLFAPPEGVLSQQGEVASTAFVLIHLLENGDENGITSILDGRGRKLVNRTVGVMPLSRQKFRQIHAHIDMLIEKLENEGNLEKGRLDRLRRLLKEMTHPDPAKRLTMEKVVSVYPTCM